MASWWISTFPHIYVVAPGVRPHHFTITSPEIPFLLAMEQGLAATLKAAKEQHQVPEGTGRELIGRALNLFVLIRPDAVVEDSDNVTIEKPRVKGYYSGKLGCYVAWQGNLGEGELGSVAKAVKLQNAKAISKIGKFCVGGLSADPQSFNQKVRRGVKPSEVRPPNPDPKKYKYLVKKDDKGEADWDFKMQVAETLEQRCGEKDTSKTELMALRGIWSLLCKAQEWEGTFTQLCCWYHNDFARLSRTEYPYFGDSEPRKSGLHDRVNKY